MHISKKSYPINLYSAAGVREMDRLAIEEYKIPAYTLMKRAGKKAFRALIEKWPSVQKLIIFCGKGNNGGDGYVIAGLAKQYGLSAEVFSIGDTAQLVGSAKPAFTFASDQVVLITAFNPELKVNYELKTIIVDSLLGTGISGNVTGAYLAAIQSINSSGLPVMAVDIPSGLCGDSGNILGEAVRATLTVSFIGLKRGQFHHKGPSCCGETVYEDLDIPEAIFKKVLPIETLSLS